MSEEYDEQCDAIEEEITKVFDKYPNYIKHITIEWYKEEELKEHDKPK